MKIDKLKNKLGQNTAEYLIMLVLISVGSIGIFSVFGGTIKAQVQNVIAAMTGDSATYNTEHSALNKKAKDVANREMSMAGIAEEDLSFKDASEDSGDGE